MQMGHILYGFLFAFSMMGVAVFSADKPISPFQYEIQKDPETVWSIVVLRYVDPDDAGRNIEIKISPETGDNLFSLAYGGRDLLVTPDPLGDLVHQHGGVKILYPAPNRMKNAEFRFNGAVYPFTPPKDFYCFENQTCSTDAHNLYEAGFRDASHLQIVAPGGSMQGTVMIEVGKI
jgi:galactose mutarotase-like enzyme